MPLWSGGDCDRPHKLVEEAFDGLCLPVFQTAIINTSRYAYRIISVCIESDHFHTIITALMEWNVYIQLELCCSNMTTTM